MTCASFTYRKCFSPRDTPMPAPGKYYLVDSAYRMVPGFLLPYRTTPADEINSVARFTRMGKERSTTRGTAKGRSCVMDPEEMLPKFMDENWEISLHINEPIYHDEELQFYANLRSTNNKDFVSRVNHVELELDKYIIIDIFNCQVRVEEDHETTDGFFSYDKFPTKKHGFDLEDLCTIISERTMKGPKILT
ncbi:hypothetical protein ACH5RR_026120 [Cinchona calisaya]|uniref:DDE Tnp4 domain-containing protein n=1 Tax=Cinchona calisaya TaxID=153742 RepID=A0ABD2Z1L1_9GENT